MQSESNLDSSFDRLSDEYSDNPKNNKAIDTFTGKVSGLKFEELLKKYEKAKQRYKKCYIEKGRDLRPYTVYEKEQYNSNLLATIEYAQMFEENIDDDYYEYRRKLIGKLVFMLKQNKQTCLKELVVPELIVPELVLPDFEDLPGASPVSVVSRTKLKTPTSMLTKSPTPSKKCTKESRACAIMGGRRRKTRKVHRKRRTQKRGKKARKGQTKRK